MNETSGEPLLGEPLLGWVAQKSADIQSEGGIDWWGEGGKTAPFGTRYVTSMYGIFNGLGLENGLHRQREVLRHLLRAHRVVSDL